MTRSRKALVNTLCEILREVITAVCGLILPRLILSHFGSTYNGITQSITQFISCVSLLKSGIGSVTRAALYKPLADNDHEAISEVVNATQHFMRKISLCFLGGVLVFAALYPILVKSYIDWFSAALLVIIISLSTFAQYYFGLTYQMVLQADQRNYIISLVQIASVIVNTLVAAVLIQMGNGIHVVKLGSAIVYMLPPLFYFFYTRKRYHINRQVKPNYSIISQRWDAFGHQLANFINDNTDVMVITILLGVKEVSFYTVYYMIAHNIRVVVMAFSTGTQGAFGNMLVKGERDNLRRRFDQFELMMFLVTTILYVTTAILFLPFIRLYMSGVNDYDYLSMPFAILICVAHYFECVKAPYSMLIFAKGSFKETKTDSYIEAGINIVSSIILARLIGINGIIIGTILAAVYRVLRFNAFVSNSIIEKKPVHILWLFTFSIICAILSYLATSFILPIQMDSFFVWGAYAIVVFIIVGCVTFLTSLVFFKKTTIGVLKVGLASVTTKFKKKH